MIGEVKENSGVLIKIYLYYKRIKFVLSLFFWYFVVNLRLLRELGL